MTRAMIDLYPGDLSLEDAPADFTLEEWPADLSVGEHGGIWATLECLHLGGLPLDRDQVLRMIGCKALVKIETEVSERLSQSGERFDMAAQ